MNHHDKISKKETEIMKKVILFLLMLIIFSGCAASSTDSEVVKEPEEQVFNIPELDKYELEIYLLMNGYYNLVFEKVEQIDTQNAVYYYNSYKPISPITCDRSLIAVNCSFDEKTEEWAFNSIESNYIGACEQPTKTHVLDIYNIGLNRITVPFSWDYIEDQNIDPNSLLYEGQTFTEEECLMHVFAFHNDWMLGLNTRTTIDVFSPETTGYDINEYSIIYNGNVWGYVYKNDTGKDDLEVKKFCYTHGNQNIIVYYTKGTLICINSVLTREQNFKILGTLESISSSFIEPISNTSPDDTYIDFNNKMYQIKLLYNMRIRSGRNQNDSIIEKANKDDVYPVYKVIDDGNYIWYCIGQGKWIGDDGTCLEAFK